MNTDKALAERIWAIKAERREVNDQAAAEYLTHGYTRHFRRLWRKVADLKLEEEWLEELAGVRQAPPKVGFTADYPPDTDDDIDDEPLGDDAPASSTIVLHFRYRKCNTQRRKKG